MAESPVSRFTYRAFISYSHRDKAWADWLHRSLETYRVPSRLVGTTTAHGTIPRRLNPVFRDREELASAAELGRKVNEALAQSENLIVICSPAAAASRWVNEEVLAYKRMGRAARIFCMIVDGEPNATGIPGREAEECFCPASRFQLDANGQPTNERVEPIAADARPGKDGKANAKLKLIAGMLDVGFDALKQREQHRRMRRMAAITALAVCVMAITIVLAIAALVSRHRAVIAQHKAEVAQKSAVRRQKQAEDLVDFMLGDLTTKLRGLDKLDILRAVDDKAVAYFKTLPAIDVNETELAQRAKALQRIGEVRMNNSRLADAMSAFQQALRLNRKLVLHTPDDPQRQNAYAENLLWVGFNDWNQGRLDRAEIAFKKSAAALERAVALAPADNQVAHNLDDMYNNLGHVALARGEADLAEREYLKDQALCQRMVAAHPNDVIWRNTLGDSHGNLAELSVTRGHLDQAISGYLKQQRIISAVMAQQPQNHQMQAQLQEDDANLIDALELTGQSAAASAYLGPALATGEALIKFDPSHKGWREEHAYIQFQAARLSRERGDADAADRLINASMTNLQELVHADPSETGWRSDLLGAEIEGARLGLQRHQSKTTTELATDAEAGASKLLAGDSPKAKLIRLAASAELLLGGLSGGRGDAAAAGKYRQQSLSRMQAVAVHSNDPRDIAILAEALLANGDETQARKNLARLSAMGYAPADFIMRLHAQGVEYAPSTTASQRIAQILKTAPADSTLAKAAAQ
jgi:tetratricopeptide (TPR) repeat protein